MTLLFRIKKFQEDHNVMLYFPPESSETSSILLVHDPLNASPAGLSSAQKQSHLDAVQKEVEKLSAESEDVKTVTIEVDSKWHSALLDRKGAILNSQVSLSLASHELNGILIS
jgi:hypothetical protein